VQFISARRSSARQPRNLSARTGIEPSCGEVREFDLARGIISVEVGVENSTFHDRVTAEDMDTYVIYPRRKQSRAEQCVNVNL
jgi:hypothetical protein